MRRPTRKTGIIFAALGVLWPGVVCADVSASRQAELMHLLTQDCGSCHGLTRNGGLGPALTREALNGKAPVMLREVILHGRPGTPMPPWKSFMSAQEADWLVQVLLEGKSDAH
ncbi:MAG: cytochrome c [Gammaproteobacteria bacterium]|nr:cytochrome c [Gammaproteobacteria bacterium]MBI5782396.1 cytochrome c [Gammaproteobacteria bacterium]